MNDLVLRNWLTARATGRIFWSGNRGNRGTEDECRKRK